MYMICWLLTKSVILLYTDDREWNKVDEWKDIPRSYVNITEDARIEKLMKRRYAGLNKTFYRGYNPS